MSAHGVRPVSLLTNIPQNSPEVQQQGAGDEKLEKQASIRRGYTTSHAELSFVFAARPTHPAAQAVQAMYTRDEAQQHLRNVLEHITDTSRRISNQITRDPAPRSVNGLFLDFPFDPDEIAGQTANKIPRRLHRRSLFIVSLF